MKQRWRNYLMANDYFARIILKQVPVNLADQTSPTGI